MTSPADASTSQVHYQFKLDGGRVWELTLHLRRSDLQLLSDQREPLPDWTRLEHQQCTHCPLTTKSHPRCPIAVHLARVADAFKDSISFEQAEITIRTEQRTYSRNLSVQYGLSSLIGVIMATSGCPIMDKLRPMVFTHLPFSSPEETIFRAASTYLLGQYFRQKRGLPADWQLKHLVELYRNVAIVNQCFSKRLATSQTQDANLNALANLDCFAVFASISIGDDSLTELEGLFGAYLEL